MDAAASKARAHARLAAGSALISAASASNAKTKHTYTLRLNTKHTLNSVRLPRAWQKLTFHGGRGEGQTTRAQSLVAKWPEKEGLRGPTKERRRSERELRVEVQSSGGGRRKSRKSSLPSFPLSTFPFPSSFPSRPCPH